MKRLGIVILLVAATVAPAWAEPVRVSRRVCDRLVTHDPLPGTAYESGVDVRGRPIVPADIGRGAVALPPMIGSDIVVPWPPDRGGRAGRDGPGSYRADPYVGQVLVAPDGTLLFNGRPLRDPEEEYVARLCRDALR